MNKTIFPLLISAALLGCGGGQTQPDDPVGESKQTPPHHDGDVGGEDPVKPPESSPVPPPMQSGIVFVMKNTHSEDLVFNMDRGWGANILAFSGKPPKAVSIIPFAKHCTASCDTAAEDRCPFCPEPEKLKDIRESQQLQTVAPGATLEVPWDGKVHVYEKSSGSKKRKCECYRVQEAAPGTYQVKACGLRLTQSASAHSQLQCIEATMTLPVEGAQRIEFDFAAPKAVGKPGKPKKPKGR